MPAGKWTQIQSRGMKETCQCAIQTPNNGHGFNILVLYHAPSFELKVSRQKWGFWYDFPAKLHVGSTFSVMQTDYRLLWKPELNAQKGMQTRLTAWCWPCSNHFHGKITYSASFKKLNEQVSFLIHAYQAQKKKMLTYCLNTFRRNSMHTLKESLQYFSYSCSKHWFLMPARTWSPKWFCFFYLGFAVLLRILHLYQANRSSLLGETGVPGEITPDVP